MATSVVVLLLYNLDIEFSRITSACSSLLGALCMYMCREVTHGIPVFTADGERVGQSTKAAQKAISLVVVSRVIMATPGMCKLQLVELCHRC